MANGNQPYLRVSISEWGNLALFLEKQQLLAEQLEAVAEALVEPSRKELIRKALGYAKGTSIIFRLNNRREPLYLYDPV